MLALTRCLFDSANLDHTDGVVLAHEHHVWQKAESRRVNLDFVAAALEDKLELEVHRSFFGGL